MFYGLCNNNNLVVLIQHSALQYEVNHCYSLGSMNSNVCNACIIMVMR